MRFFGVSYALRGRLALGGFEDGDHDGFAIDFGEFLRIRGVIDSGDADGFEDPDEFVEHLDNQRW